MKPTNYALLSNRPVSDNFVHLEYHHIMPNMFVTDGRIIKHSYSIQTDEKIINQ
ncbi:MAG: hypothetical protein VSS52_006015 [Thiotrichaceae bacterium]|nr:hypothetical protein [Thiotrichaceae bacterium]